MLHGDPARAGRHPNPRRPLKGGGISALGRLQPANLKPMDFDAKEINGRQDFKAARFRGDRFLVASRFGFYFFILHAVYTDCNQPAWLTGCNHIAPRSPAWRGVEYPRGWPASACHSEPPDRLRTGRS